jgi:hypothetical protein
VRVVVRGRPNPLQAAGRDGGLKLMEIKRLREKGHRITLINEQQFWNLVRTTEITETEGTETEGTETEGTETRVQHGGTEQRSFFSFSFSFPFFGLRCSVAPC